MYALSVTFEAVSGRAELLQEALLTQAENSLQEEEGCLQFDVAADPDKEGRFFLYEVYTDEDAIAKHRQTAHYAVFIEKTADLVANKEVNRWKVLRGKA